MADDILESDRQGDSLHPRETADLLGHEAAEQALLDAYLSGRLPHGWVFGGPMGIGKATLAYRFARFLFKYPEPELARAAGATSLQVPENDPVFARVSALGHGDLLVLRRPWDPKTKKLKKALPVDEIRRTAGFFGKKSAEGGWRICIVDAADDMNVNAANAILKVLEEPPARALMILIAHSPGRLLPTIRSRCRRLTLSALSDRDVTSILTSQIGDMAAEEAAVLARLSQGSAGRAMALAAAGGLDLYRQLLALFGQMPRIDIEDLHKFADGITGRNADEAYVTAMELLDEWLMRLIRLKATGEMPAPFTAEESEVLARLAGAGRLDHWMEVWENLGRSVARAEALNMDRKQLILTAFADLEQAARAA